MTIKLTEKLMAEWRTGLHAANPEQAKALVAEIDRLRARGATTAVTTVPAVWYGIRAKKRPAWP